jgi:ABC-type nickel/cobalt efflux system permease component RcnA
MLWGAARGVRLKKSLPWIVFFGVLLLLVFSNSSYVKMFDYVLGPVRFGILAGFSILLVWSRWRHRRDDAASSNAASPDAADHFLSSAVRWFHRDSRRSKQVARLFWVQAAIPAA